MQYVLCESPEDTSEPLRYYALPDSPNRNLRIVYELASAHVFDVLEKAENVKAGDVRLKNFKPLALK